VAERLRVSTETVGRHERGTATPGPDLQRAYCELYRATGQELGFIDLPPDVEIVQAPFATDEIAEIMARVRTLGRVGDDELTFFELGVAVRPRRSQRTRLPP
jgi:hypothetical protein